MHGRTNGVLIISALVVLGGCATVPREAGFGDVEKAVASRGGQRIHWNQGSAADQQVAEVTRSMLNKQLTAEEAVQIALLNNRELQAVYEDLTIAQADLVAAGLLSNPVFDTEIRFFDDGVSSESAVVMNFLEVLYLPLRKRVAAARFDATKLRVAGAALDLAAETRAAFLELQGAQQTVEMRRQVLLATEASYEVAKRLREAGNTTELDLVNERSLHEQSKLNLAVAEARVLRDRERLNELMGLWGDQTKWQTALRLPDAPVGPAGDVAATGLERRAVEQSLDLGAARGDIEAAARVLGIARPFSMIPSVDAGVSVEGEPGGEWGVGPALSLPIPLFNQGQPAVASALADLRRAQQHYVALGVTVRARVRAARSAVIAARDRANYYKAVILPLRQQAVEQTMLQYNAMQVGPFQLLLAKQQQIDAGAEYIETLKEYWLAKAELDMVLNGRMSRMRPPEPVEPRSAAGVFGGEMTEARGH